MSEEYVVQFDSHGDHHEASIDLECFANALKPYLKTDAFQKQEPRIQKCGCGKFQFCETIHRVDGPCYQIDKPTPSSEKCRCAMQDICPVHPELAANINKPTASQEKCGCRGQICPFDHDCACHKGPQKAWDDKPKDAVEEKIRELKREYMCQLERGGGSYQVVESMIRDLVRLARETK